MARNVMTFPELIGMLQKTGKMHLLAKGQIGPADPPKRPNLAVSPPSGGQDSPQRGQKGKKRLQMTKPEAEFARILEARKLKGEIAAWLYEPFTLRWGVLDVLKYTPDFVIFDSIEEFSDGVPMLKMRMIEVKGSFIHNESRAMRTFKDARNQWHGLFHFELWQQSKAEGWQQVL